MDLNPDSPTPATPLLDRLASSHRTVRVLVGGLATMVLLIAITVVVSLLAAREIQHATHQQLIAGALPLRLDTGALLADVLAEDTAAHAIAQHPSGANSALYLSAVGSVERDLARIGPHLAGHPGLMALVAGERAAIMRLEAFLSEQVAAAESGPEGRRDALAKIGSDRTRLVTVHRAAARVNTASAALVTAADRSSESTLNTLVLVVSVLGAIAVVLGAAIAALLVIVVGRNARRLRRAADDLLARSTELERSNAQLEEFAYVASHDLSEPLRAVAGFAQLLQRRYRGRLDADADEFIGFVVDGVGRMQRLITDLLEFSRAGRRDLDLVAVNCETLMERLLDTLRPRIEETGATVTVAQLPTVTADEGLLERVFSNLLANALKFTDGTPPRIAVDALHEDGHWRFSVADDGIGVPEPQHERVFRMFQRLHGRDEYAGTGIGLAVSRTIVERHGGRIGLLPNRPRGTVFWFSLPDREPAHG